MESVKIRQYIGLALDIFTQWFEKLIVHQFQESILFYYNFYFLEYQSKWEAAILYGPTLDAPVFLKFFH